MLLPSDEGGLAHSLFNRSSSPSRRQTTEKKAVLNGPFVFNTRPTAAKSGVPCTCRTPGKRGAAVSSRRIRGKGPGYKCVAPDGHAACHDVTWKFLSLVQRPFSIPLSLNNDFPFKSSCWLTYKKKRLAPRLSIIVGDRSPCKDKSTVNGQTVFYLVPSLILADASSSAIWKIWVIWRVVRSASSRERINFSMAGRISSSISA